MRSPAGITIRNDAEGLGEFGAPRKNKVHRGVDICVVPNTIILSPVKGTVKRLGICYSDDHTYRLIIIEDALMEHRILYVEPLVMPGDKVNEGDVIGHAQDISKRYSPLMKPHIHWEIIVRGLLDDGDDSYSYMWINPLNALGVKT